MTTPNYVDPQTIHNPSTGGTPPASWGDAVRDGLEALAGPPICSCRTNNTSVDTITTSGSWTAVKFSSWLGGGSVELIDTDGFHSTSSNPERFTIPTGKDGIYLIMARTRWSQGDDRDDTVAIAIQEGGSNQYTMSQSPVSGNNVNGTDLCGMVMLPLAAGNYIQLIAYRANPSPHVQIDLLSAQLDMIKISR